MAATSSADVAWKKIQAQKAGLSLQPVYPETLSEGPHTLTVLFEDGQAEIAFEILKEAETEPESSTEPADTQTPDQPATGDHSQPLLWILLMASALLLGIAGVVISIRKRI